MPTYTCTHIHTCTCTHTRAYTLISSMILIGLGNLSTTHRYERRIPDRADEKAKSSITQNKDKPTNRRKEMIHTFITNTKAWDALTQ